MKTLRLAVALLIVVGAAGVTTAEEPAGDSEAELAKKLNNPIASLISVPIQSNWDFHIGPKDAMRYYVNVQPVIPFSLTKDWNLITRTIMPIVHLESVAPGVDEQNGLGDVTQSFFLSPTDPVGGWIVGGGPVFLYPTATNNSVGAQKWGGGPTAVVLKQESGWTYGILANHLWSFAGSSHRANVNATFLQPFLAYTTKTYTTFTLNTESTYDWAGGNWTVPLNPQISQVLKIGGMPISIGAGGRYYAAAPAGGPLWGLRFVVTFLFPTKG